MNVLLRLHFKERSFFSVRWAGYVESIRENAKYKQNLVWKK